MSDKFWNFSRTERIAAIALTVIIVVIMATTLLMKRQNSLSQKDYSAEIEEFKSRVVDEDTIKQSKRKSRKKREPKLYTPNRQNLTPILKE